MNQTFIKYSEIKATMLETKEIDLLQTRFKCCGLNSYIDWKKFSDFDSKEAISKHKLLISKEQIPFDLPDTCCTKIGENCGKNYRFLSEINLDGCSSPFTSFLNNRIIIICCLMIGISVINALSILCLIYASVSLKADYTLIKRVKKVKENIDSEIDEEVDLDY